MRNEERQTLFIYIIAQTVTSVRVSERVGKIERRRQSIHTSLLKQTRMSTRNAIRNESEPERLNTGLLFGMRNRSGCYLKRMRIHFSSEIRVS